MEFIISMAGILAGAALIWWLTSPARDKED